MPQVFDTPPGIAAVNISAGTLSDPAFPARVGTALLRHRVPAEMLEIEVPEDVATRDLDAIAPVLEDLRALGVRLALDAFGGGLSSISHLVRLPVGLVKLDRSIIAGLPGSSERAMLRAVVAMACSLAFLCWPRGSRLTHSCSACDGKAASWCRATCSVAR